MRTIIAGSRGFTDPHLIHQVMLDVNWDVSTVISGTATGIDVHGERWAEEYRIPVEKYPADWNKHGRAAGPIRNAEMADIADALVVIWDGESRGTKNMVQLALKKGLLIHLVTIPNK